MHTMWKGSVSFGLVNMPVKMLQPPKTRIFGSEPCRKCGPP